MTTIQVINNTISECQGHFDTLEDLFSYVKEDAISYQDFEKVIVLCCDAYASQFNPEWVKNESEADLPKDSGIV